MCIYIHTVIIILVNVNLKVLVIFVMYSGPLAVVDEHFNSRLPNCYDAIGLMLMIRIIHQHQVIFIPWLSFALRFPLISNLTFVSPFFPLEFWFCLI